MVFPRQSTLTASAVMAGGLLPPQRCNFRPERRRGRALAPILRKAVLVLPHMETMARTAEMSASSSRLLYSAPLFAMRINSLLLPWLSRRLTGPWIALLIGPVSVVFLLLCALTRSFPYLLGLLLCSAVSYAPVASNNIIFRQSRTPEPLLSRVNTSGRILAWGMGTTLGALIGGAVASTAGVRWAITTAAGFAALAALIGWLSPLRREPLRAAPR